MPPAAPVSGSFLYGLSFCFCLCFRLGFCTAFLTDFLTAFLPAARFTFTLPLAAALSLPPSSSLSAQVWNSAAWGAEVLFLSNSAFSAFQYRHRDQTWNFTALLRHACPQGFRALKVHTTIGIHDHAVTLGAVHGDEPSPQIELHPFHFTFEWVSAAAPRPMC